jgi:hypothetical protein
MRKAFHLLKGGESTESELKATLELADKVRGCIGHCIEDVVKHQAHVLTATTVAKRDDILAQHKSEVPEGLRDWLRAQPVLTGKSLFGKVADKAKPLQTEYRAKMKDDVVIGLNKADKRHHPYKQASAPKRTFSNYKAESSASFGDAGRSKAYQKPKSKPDFSSSSYKKADRGKRKPFQQGGARGRGRGSRN